MHGEDTMTQDPTDAPGQQPAPRPPARAVIFDLDGTLVDSEPNYFLADRQLLAKYGVAYSEADNRRYVGRGSLDMMRDMVRRHGLAADPELLVAEKNAIYLELAEHATRVYPQMQRFLDLLVAHRVPVAVASGSSPEVVVRILAAVGLAGTFAQVVSAEDVPRGKPAPDVFLETARRLGVPPGHCVVVEDACPGVEAARRAGMRCIAVPYLTEPPLPALFGLAELLYPDGMQSFDPGQAWAWFDGESRRWER
jgi:beta-phosphoglucomutase family hydrolase